MTMNIDNWLTYESFVLERHRIWEQRQAGVLGPWTDDPILSSRKFTNVFRVLDPGSQFVLTDLFGDEYQGSEDGLARVLLYRHTNHPAVWRQLKEDWGRYPTRTDLVTPSSLRWMDATLNTYKDEGMLVFNPAYLIYPGKEKGANKVRSILTRVQHFLLEHRTLAGLTLEEKVNLLRSHDGIGDFIAMQVATDFNYGPLGDDQENDFIVAGPGAVKGASYLRPGESPEDTIRRIQFLWALSSGPRLFGRIPSLMDVQNTLCEFSKLVRYLNSPPGTAYTPAHPGPQPIPVLPEHWRLETGIRPS